MLAELIERVGEEHRIDHLYLFGIAEADYVADFHNNGGLVYNNNGWDYAIQYASVGYGYVQIGAWVWGENEDFDQDATFEVFDEDDLSEGELKKIYDKIVEIYGTV